MIAFRHAWAFLTRLPGGAHPPDTAALARSVPWFPVVGLIIGALTALVYGTLLEVLPPLTAAGVSLAFSALATGAFHEDGFADSLDALTGGRDVAERIRILKDSRHGTFGVLGLVLLTLVKASALASMPAGVALAALVAAGSLGRTGAVGMMGWAPAATGEGLGSTFLATVTRGDVVLTLGIGAVVGLAALGPLGPPAILLVGLCTGIVALWALNRIGGISGDLLGAAEQVGEIVVLLLMAGVAGERPWFA